MEATYRSKQKVVNSLTIQKHSSLDKIISVKTNQSNIHHNEIKSLYLPDILIGQPSIII